MKVIIVLVSMLITIITIFYGIFSIVKESEFYKTGALLVERGNEILGDILDNEKLVDEEFIVIDKPTSRINHGWFEVCFLIKNNYTVPIHVSLENTKINDYYQKEGTGGNYIEEYEDEYFTFPFFEIDAWDNNIRDFYVEGDIVIRNNYDGKEISRYNFVIEHKK